MGNLAKLFKVSTVAVLKWIRNAAVQIEDKPVQKPDIIMVDEFWHFVNGKKNKIWMWRAIDGVSRIPLGYRLGDRTDSALRKLIKKVDTGMCYFLTDD